MVDKAYGRREPKNAPAIRFGAVREAQAVIPEHPTAFNSIEGKSGWEILKNDSWGDCVVVTYYTMRRIMSWLTGADLYPPTEAELLALYRTQNPDFDPNSSTHGPGSAADGGMDIQSLLEMLHQDGWEGVKVLAFAKVDHTSPEEMKAALAEFRCLWLGVNVTDTNESEFDQHAAWTRSGRVLGGHSITGTGYDTQQFGMQTWADFGFLAANYVTGGTARGAGLEEAWIVVWAEHAALLTDAQKAALGQAYTALTGGTIEWPDAPFQPPPVDPPPATDPVAAFVAAAEAWVALRHSSKANTEFEKDVQAYLDHLKQ